MVVTTTSRRSRTLGEVMTVTLAQLLEGSPTLEVARPNESVVDAMERMREHDYSQLPVVDPDASELRAIGLISMTTIARAVLHLNAPPSQLRVSLAIDRHPTRCKLTDEL